MTTASPQASGSDTPFGCVRILVIGGSSKTLDLLRVAILCSEDVLLVTPHADASVRRFVDLFAIETWERAPRDSDLSGASSALVSIGDADAENGIVRAARRRGVPIFVGDRALVSDFKLIELLEQRTHISAAA